MQKYFSIQATVIKISDGHKKPRIAFVSQQFVKKVLNLRFYLLGDAYKKTPDQRELSQCLLEYKQKTN